MERVRTLKLRDKLQLYAEALTSLEVRVTGQTKSTGGKGDGNIEVISGLSSAESSMKSMQKAKYTSRGDTAPYTRIS